jgi:hypothetical protein
MRGGNDGHSDDVSQAGATVASRQALQVRPMSEPMLRESF